jgi:hypothetical protein
MRYGSIRATAVLLLNRIFPISSRQMRPESFK